jgi:hypothetical protein
MRGAMMTTDKYKMMTIQRKRMALVLTCFLVVALLCHCTSWLGSATLRITYYLEDGIYCLEDEVQSAKVDLRENSDWKKHHDNVTGISRLLFAFWVINPVAIDATAQFYISTEGSLTTAQDIQDQATLVLDGISVPAQDSVYVSAQDSYQYFRNVDELADRLIEGQFYLYCIADAAPFQIKVPDSAAFVVEFTYAVDWEF